MNGLRETYGSEIDFRYFNIGSEKGRAWAAQYNLRGHPAYLLLDADGTESWRAVGVFPRETIEAEIQAVLE